MIIKNGTQTEWGEVISHEKQKDGIYYTVKDEQGYTSLIPEQLFNLQKNEKQDWEKEGEDWKNE